MRGCILAIFFLINTSIGTVAGSAQGADEVTKQRMMIEKLIHECEELKKEHLSQNSGNELLGDSEYQQRCVQHFDKGRRF